MKKLLTMLTTFCVVLCFAACSSNTPSGVAEQSIKYLMEEKYDKYTDLLYVSDADKEDPEKLKKDKEEFTQLLEAKYSETVKNTGGIDSYKVTSEDVADGGETAVVHLDVTYKNGKTDDYAVKLRKDSDGNWKVTLGK